MITIIILSLKTSLIFFDFLSLENVGSGTSLTSLLPYYFALLLISPWHNSIELNGMVRFISKFPQNLETAAIE